MKTAPTNKAWILLLALTLAGGTALLAVAQQQQPPREQKEGPLKPKQSEEQAPYTLRVDVPVVNVDVTVVDKNGNIISGLQREHFRVFQDGKEQSITAFAPTEAPITTVLVVEVTRAVGYILFENLEGAFYFLRQLRKEDWAALVAYDMRPRIEADFTQNRQDIVQALRRLQYASGTFSEANMYDAVIDTLDRLEDVEGKKSIIVIGTGLDTFSKHTWDDARRAAREHDTTIFAINMSWLLELNYDRLEAYGIRTNLGRMSMQMARAQMRDLAQQTGGRYYQPRFASQFPGIYGEVAGMLRNQYSLSFQPKDFKPDGKYHKIEVKLVAPNGQPLEVRDQNNKKVKYKVYARKGYIAPEA